jgi:pimeloyl-ACP methyl ester carboxylesterase
MEHLENLPSQLDVMVQDLLAAFPKHFDIESKLGDIKANTLIIGGLEDDIAEVKYQKVLNKAIPNSTLKMYRDNRFC